MKMRMFLLLLVAVVAMAAVKEAAAASTIVTTDPDGTINCDGLKCPLGAQCTVSGATTNGRSLMTRRCLNSQGAVVAESAYEVESPGMLYGRQSATAVLTYTKS